VPEYRINIIHLIRIEAREVSRAKIDLEERNLNVMNVNYLIIYIPYEYVKALYVSAFLEIILSI
jgi:hypothetical protein